MTCTVHIYTHLCTCAISFIYMYVVRLIVVVDGVFAGRDQIDDMRKILDALCTKNRSG